MKKTALVTGAASGLGLEFSHLLARDSFDLILVDIDRGRLVETKKILKKKYDASVDILALDLSKPLAAAKIYEGVKGRKIEVLINNAGFGLSGFFSKTDWRTEEAMIYLHVLTLTHLTKLILKDMLANKSGKIMNVSSLAAFQPGPLMAIYYATKAYILSFSEALANEVKGTGVTVTVFCPGLTKTNFQKSAATLSGAKESTINFRTPSPRAVSHYGYKAMMAGKPVAIQGWVNKLTALLPRFVPRAFAVSMVRRIQEKLRE